MVKCNICGRTKKPVGRDSHDNGLCSHECEGYRQEPYASSYWPDELREEFERGKREGAEEERKRCMKAANAVNETASDAFGGYEVLSAYVIKKHVLEAISSLQHKLALAEKVCIEVEATTSIETPRSVLDAVSEWRKSK